MLGLKSSMLATVFLLSPVDWTLKAQTKFYNKTQMLRKANHTKYKSKTTKIILPKLLVIGGKPRRKMTQIYKHLLKIQKSANRATCHLWYDSARHWKMLTAKNNPINQWLLDFFFFFFLTNSNICTHRKEIKGSLNKVANSLICQIRIFFKCTILKNK